MWDTDMTGNDVDDGLGLIRAEAHPDPVLEYAIPDAEPVVVGFNAQFRSEFGVPPKGASVTEGLAQFGITPVDADAASRIVGGEASEFQVTIGSAREAGGQPSKRYRATVIPDPENSAGHIVFRPTAGPDSTERNELGLDHVASVVSHDLRNPLEVAKTRLRAGRDTGNDDHFEHVARAHDRMERIIEDVLTLARGEDTIDPSEEVELTEIAEAAWESVDSDGATLSVDSRLPAAVVDADRTGRVFENLFRNAVEHGSTSPAPEEQDAVEHGSASDSPSADGDAENPDPPTDGPPEIRVGRIESDSGSGFYVADDGPGIPSSERDAVFEPGYSTHDHGTGLGLAIVHQIADAHRWDLRITSADGGGARVEVRNL
jgi:signal transduction histidine kinase